MQNKRTTLAFMGALAVLVAVAFAGGHQQGYAGQKSVAELQAEVAAEYRKLADNQAQVIILKDATITEQQKELDRLMAELKKAQKKTAPKPAGTDWKTVSASWYGPGLYGNRTADGTHYGPKTWCVAHKSLPLGTMLELTYNGKTVKVPVKDRGPYVAGRELDLSNAVAVSLGFSGVQTVSYRILPRGDAK